MSKERIFFDNFFSNGQGPSNVGELNWDLLGFFSFVFSLAQCVLRYFPKNVVSKMQIQKDIDPIVTLLSLSTTLYPGLGSAPFHSDKDYLSGGQT